MRDLNPVSGDAGSRLLTGTGLRNLRDLGGMAVDGGGSTRYGMVYRSEAPTGLSDAEIGELGRIGLCATIDLRAAGVEDIFEPPRLPEGVRRLEAGVVPPANAENRGLLHQVMEGDLLDYTAAELGAMYVDFIESAAPAFGRAIALLADPDNLPALIHCHAGKDRTGIAVALLLTVAGVPREAIVADYELSSAGRAHRRAEVEEVLIARGTDWERVAPLFVAPGEALVIALAHLDREHGSVRAYLTGAGGVDPASIDRLVAAFVEPRPGL